MKVQPPSARSLSRSDIEVAYDLWRRCEMLQGVIDGNRSLSATDLRGYLKIMREAYTALYFKIEDAGDADKLRAAVSATRT